MPNGRSSLQSDLADFSTEPDFNPSGPTSLRRWLTGSPPPSQPVQQDHPLSSPRREDVSRSPTASPQGTTENLAEFLDRIENQAQTYENGGMDSLVENYRWLHVPSRPIIDSRGMLQPSHAGPYPVGICPSIPRRLSARIELPLLTPILDES